MAKVLIVEDEVFIQQHAAFIVEDLGHETLLASDVDEALAHLAEQIAIDILFVDIRLRELALGGYEVANHAVTLHPGLRVLYTSGSTLSAEMTDRFVAGGRFLQKPYSPVHLGSAMHEMLH